MTTRKHKVVKKHKRSKKYRGGTDKYDNNRSSSVSSDWGLMDTSFEAETLDPYKKAKFWNNFGYGATAVGLATVIGIIVMKKMK